MAEIFEIEGIIVIGGDGTFRAYDLCRLGILVIGIPATIDNDVSFRFYYRLPIRQQIQLLTPLIKSGIP